MWSNILLGIVVLMGMAYGLYLMFRMDDFMKAEQHLQDMAVDMRSESLQAIVFGGEKLAAEIGELLEMRGITPLFIDEIGVQQEWENIQWVVALSQSDTDNLSLCNLIRKMYHTERLFSICNENINLAVYKRFQVRILEEEAIKGQLDAALAESEVSIA